MLNQTKTYYCVQKKYDCKELDKYILFRTRKLARQYKSTTLDASKLAIVKVNVDIIWN